MPPDEIPLACRLSGLSVDELWLRFVETGGNRSKAELRDRLAGGWWPGADDRVLAVVAAEAVRDAGLPPLEPPAPAVDARVQRLLRAAPEIRPVGVRPLGEQMTTLFARCEGARAAARDVRARAVSVRRASARTCSERPCWPVPPAG